jgi:hypothetical protein
MVDRGTISILPMPRLSPLSSLTIPWTTLKLAGRFAIPLTLWFTVGWGLRYAIFYAGYQGRNITVVPVLTLSFAVLVQLAVTVAMLHSVRDGLAAIRRRDMRTLAPWAAQDDESIFDAMGRALLPFLIFYLAWGMLTADAQELIGFATGRGFAEGGLFQQVETMGILLTLEDKIWFAAAGAALFFVVKSGTEWWVLPRLARVGPLLLAVFELHWTLFGLFSIDKLRGDAGEWLSARSAWEPVGVSLSWAGPLWEPFKFAVLGALVWLVIAGVILGVDTDESAAVGSGRVGRRLAAVSGVDKQRSPREILSRELREKWFPAIQGLRLVRQAGWMVFGVFCVLFAGLDVGEHLLRRGIYYVIGPHPIPFWMVRLPVIDFAVDLVHTVLRICLLAAAFNLLVARVSARTAAPQAPPGPAGQMAGYAGRAPLS